LEDCADHRRGDEYWRACHNSCILGNPTGNGCVGNSVASGVWSDIASTRGART
jgi:hypothetical protein